MDKGDLQAVRLHDGQGSKHGREGSPDISPQGHGQHPGLLSRELELSDHMEHHLATKMENVMTPTTPRYSHGVM